MLKLLIFKCFLLSYFTITVFANKSEAKFSKIFVQCVSAQGNGFNWASTVGWLSAEIEQMARKASQYEKTTGRTAGVDISCFTGSSSSGFTAALFDHLLHNPNLVPNASEKRKVLTVAQTFNIAKALHFLSLSMDFNANEKAEVILSSFGSKLGFLEPGLPQEKGPFWSANASASKAIQIFNKWIKAADYYQKSWLNHEKNASAYVHGQIKNKASKVLEISNDFCTTVFVLPMTNAIRPFQLANLKMLFICNMNTVAKLVDTSAHLRNLLANGSIMKNQFMIGWTKSWERAQNMTVREPDLTEALMGRLTSSPIGLSQAFTFNNGVFQTVNNQEEFLVIGGFPDPRMQAWIGTALLQDRMEKLRNQGFEVEGRVAIFGKTEERTNPDFSFAQKMMVKYFTNYHNDGNLETVQVVLNNYYRWQDDFCRATDSLSSQIDFDYFRMDWNLTDKPAAFTGQSRNLTRMGYNLVQIQSDFTKHSDVTPQAILYVPFDQEIFVPSPPADGMKCRL